MNLAAASAADGPALAGLHARCFDAPWSADTFAELFATPGVAGLMAGPASSPAGFILWRLTAGEGEVLSLGVDPQARRSGLGLVLVEAALGLAVAQAATAMFLEVGVDNPAAKGLYLKAGFAEAGLRRGYYARPGGARVDAVVMRCDLNRDGRPAYS